MKPTIDLYIGRCVSAITRGEQPWEWGVRLENGVEIRNKDRRETFVPQDIVGAQIQTIAYSLGDTTVHFSNGHKWSFNPTQYAIYDPAYSQKGEVWPQWPEELEEAGIPSHPEEGVSAEAEEGWTEHREGLLREHDQRIADNAKKFLAGEDDNA
jgi:hypothetical protein